MRIPRTVHSSYLFLNEETRAFYNQLFQERRNALVNALPSLVTVSYSDGKRDVDDWDDHEVEVAVPEDIKQDYAAEVDELGEVPDTELGAPLDELFPLSEADVATLKHSHSLTKEVQDLIRRSADSIYQEVLAFQISGGIAQEKLTERMEEEVDFPSFGSREEFEYE